MFSQQVFSSVIFAGGLSRLVASSLLVLCEVVFHWRFCGSVVLGSAVLGCVVLRFCSSAVPPLPHVHPFEPIFEIGIDLAKLFENLFVGLPKPS